MVVSSRKEDKSMTCFRVFSPDYCNYLNVLLSWWNLLPFWNSKTWSISAWLGWDSKYSVETPHSTSVLCYFPDFMWKPKSCSPTLSSCLWWHSPKPWKQVYGRSTCVQAGRGDSALTWRWGQWRLGADWGALWGNPGCSQIWTLITSILGLAFGFWGQTGTRITNKVVLKGNKQNSSLDQA